LGFARYLSSLHSLRRNGNIGLSNPKAINVGLRLLVVGDAVVLEIEKGQYGAFVTRVKMTSLLLFRHRALAVHEKRSDDQTQGSNGKLSESSCSGKGGVGPCTAGATPPGAG
jgi:hypothetical protein